MANLLDLLLKGIPGTTWRVGAGAPSNTLGLDGDFYLNSTNGDVYVKAAGSYSVNGNIKGATGSNGSNGTPGTVWRSGSGVPSNGTGVDGDYYLRTSNGDVYQRASGTYSVVGNIAGPAGAAGAGSNLNWSPVDYGTLNQSVENNLSGNQTSGCQFAITVPATITGIRFYWAGGSVSIKATIFKNSDGTRLVSKTISTSGAGVYTATFDTPLAITTSDVVSRFLNCAVWDTTGAGGHYTARTTIQDAYEPSFPFMGGPKMVWNNCNRFATGDNNPTSGAGSERYPVEPVFTVP